MKSNKDGKKIFESKIESNTKKVPKKPLFKVQKNVKEIKSNKVTIEQEDVNPKIRSNKVYGSGIMSEPSKLNFNKILNLDTQPGKIKFKDNQKDKDTVPSIVVKTETTVNDSIMSINIAIFKANAENVLRNVFGNIVKKKAHVSLNDVMREVQTLSNKRNFDNDQEIEEVGRMLKNVRELAESFNKKLEESKEEHFSALVYKR